jgi:alpha-mannosidase
MGAEYPNTSLDTAWKLLLKCHAHDSIAGSGVDDIERDTLHRLRQTTNISKSLFSRALQHIQLHIDNSDAETGDVLLTLFNPSPFARSEVVTAYLDLPLTSGFGAFSIVEADTGKEVPMQIAWRKPQKAIINHALDATAMMDCERAAVHLYVEDIPPMGYMTLKVVRKAAMRPEGVTVSANAMENEHLCIEFNGDGSFNLLDKSSGAVYGNMNYFEDSGEVGNAWMHIEPALDSILTTLGRPARISLRESGPVLARYEIEHELMLPVGYDDNGSDTRQRLDGGPNRAKRSDERRLFKIISHVTLKKGARAVEIRTEFDNTCRNHRLRAMFPSNIDSKVCDAESPFDVVRREIEYAPDSPWAGAINPTFPMQRFVDISDAANGLAIINDGLKEYGVTATPDHTIAITLLRAFEISLTTVSKRWDIHPEMELSQAPGRHEFRYLVYPHAGDWADANVTRLAETLPLPIIPAQAAKHAGTLAKRMPFLKTEPVQLVLSGVKQAEDGQGIVVRAFNPTTQAITGEIWFYKEIAVADQVNMEELSPKPLKVKGNAVIVSVEPKKVVTVRVRF